MRTPRSRRSLALALALTLGTACQGPPAPDHAAAAGAAAAPDSAAAQGATLASDDASPPAAVLECEPFALIDHRGVSHELERLTHVEGVVLVTHALGAPSVAECVPVLEDLASRFAGRAELFLLVADSGATRAELAAEAGALGTSLPILHDDTGLVVEALAVERTAEAFLVEPESRRIRYRGAVLPEVDASGRASGGLAAALEAFLAGAAIERPWTPARGAPLPLAGAPADHESIDYVADVAPILAESCASCHHAGGIAPFALDGYAAVRRWSPMIREVVLAKRMPPFAADHALAPLASDLALTREEARTLVHWIDQGARADPALAAGHDPLAARAAEAAAAERDWPLGDPDVIVTLPEPEELPAEGVPPYRYRWVDLPNTQDLWVRAATIKPSSPQVAHHIVVVIEYPEHLKHLEPKQDNGTAGYFTVYKPNQPSQVFPEGSGKLIPAGSRAMFQLHYVTSGRPETDQPSLGLYLLPARPEQVLETTGLNDPYLVIPPETRRHAITKELAFPEDVLLFSMGPHMHFRGRSMLCEAHYPDGRIEALLNVPRYDFNWQDTYWFAEPRFLPAGTRIVAHAVWDNSRHNPVNPNPKKRVVFGQDSWSEMFILYMDYMKVR